MTILSNNCKNDTGNGSPERVLDALRLLANEVDQGSFGDSGCSWEQYGDDYIPTAQDINQCLAETATCDDFDTSYCDNQECILGYEVDSNDCEISCNCKDEGLFEGDIMIEKSDVEGLKYEYGLTPFPRAAMRDRNKIWNKNTNKAGSYIVPYQLNQGITSSRRAVNAIKAAMQEIEAKTCLRFENKLAEDYIEFIDGQGCYSDVGRKGGKQEISIGKMCAYKGLVIHEMMHALGFWHEQSRPDRDDFVTVLMTNIRSNKKNNFKKRTRQEVNSMRSPYDLRSVMHYNGYSFSKNNKPTLIDKNTGRPVRAQRVGMSSEDVKQLYNLYKCGS